MRLIHQRAQKRERRTYIQTEIEKVTRKVKEIQMMKRKRAIAAVMRKVVPREIKKKMREKQKAKVQKTERKQVRREQDSPR